MNPPTVNVQNDLVTSELSCEISFLGNSDIWYHAAEQKRVQFHTNLIQLKCNPKFYCETYTCTIIMFQTNL